MGKYEKSEKHFNFIDVLIILSVLLILVTTLFRAQIITLLSDTEHRKNCVIHFQSESVSNESLEYIKEGISLSWNKQELGRLDKFQATDNVKYIQKNNGEYEKVIDTSNSIITGVISASVLYDEENGCFIGGTSLLTPGMLITVYSDKVQLALTVTEIEY